jgi:hypothetical protein
MSEQDFHDLTEKEILIGVLTELQQIRLTLQSTQADTETQTAVLSCQRCEWEGPQEKATAHAREAHKAPPSLADSLFTEP